MTLRPISEDRSAHHVVDASGAALPYGSDVLVTTISVGPTPPSEPVTWLALLHHQWGDGARFRRFLLTLLVAAVFVLAVLATAPLHAASLVLAARGGVPGLRRLGRNRKDDTA
jgi:hypothetical protein